MPNAGQAEPDSGGIAWLALRTQRPLGRAKLVRVLRTGVNIGHAGALRDLILRALARADVAVTA
jgi:hypothetical protein